MGYVETVPPQYPSLYSALWPDVLLPNGPLAIAGTDLGLFWVEVKVPRDAAPGTYHGQLTLEADGQPRAGPRPACEVFEFALPDRVPLPIAVWTSVPRGRRARR